MSNWKDNGTWTKEFKGIFFRSIKTYKRLNISQNYKKLQINYSHSLKHEHTYTSTNDTIELLKLVNQDINNNLHKPQDWAACAWCIQVAYQLSPRLYVKQGSVVCMLWSLSPIVQR